MGILDDAIKEHLELKRAHGADASELKQLEDEAFGAADRPGDEAVADPAAEAPTEFMQQPDLDAEPDAVAPGAPEAELPEAAAPPGRRAELADLQEPPPAPEQAVEPEQPAEEESPAMEHETIPEAAAPVEPSGPTTEEREAIAEQPTEMYDLEEELIDGEEGDSGDEVAYEDDEDDDFWDEKRLSDELDQALEAPSEAEPPAPAPPEEAPAAEEPAAPSPEQRPAEGEEDVLEETPEFLEEAPEADRLWFEQKPPKDFDFDD